MAGTKAHGGHGAQVRVGSVVAALLDRIRGRDAADRQLAQRMLLQGIRTMVGREL